MAAKSQQSKLCFVTVGATASFDALIKAVLSASFITHLGQLGYTEVKLQYGKDGLSLLEKLGNDQQYQHARSKYNLTVTGYDFNPKGLGVEMGAARNGVVISHAGSGSILDACRMQVPIIVVPNESLLDNHQMELAEEMAAQGYVTHGRLDDLPSALLAIEEGRQSPQIWPPSDPQNQGKGLLGILDDELGFVD